MDASPLAAWESFYVIAGSSGAALTGLQFVVMALAADTRSGSTNLEIDAFGTPTVVHFSAVLLISGILSAPWPTITGVAIALGVCGALGIAYTGLIIRRATRRMGYKPVLEDWLWHCAFPLIAYVTMLVSGIDLEPHATMSLFAVAAAVLLLLFIGIHNSWDTVTYLVITRSKEESSAPKG
jgi:hypothetical protein